MELNTNDRKIICLSFLLLAFVILIRTAWIGDDAAITLRAVLNFVNGYGPLFNPGERVQVYTNPLWFILISGGTFFFKNIYIVTYFLSFFFSLLTLWFLVSKVPVYFWGGIIVGCGLLLSKAYIDYSTSGLENPLSHFILISGFWFGFKYFDAKSAVSARISLIILFLVYLSRPDLILLILPFTVLIIQGIPAGTKRSSIYFWALLPIIIWTLFSTIYYGFPFPNTAYAKLGGGISYGERSSQGLLYLIDSFVRDPITLCLIILGMWVGFSQSKDLRALSWGILVYLIYIVAIGGDFMSGRFFTPCLLASAVILCRVRMNSYAIKTLLIFITILGLVSLKATLLSGRNYTHTFNESNGITDERGCYFQTYSLATANRNLFKPPLWEPKEKNVSTICGNLGYEGIKAGPSTYFIDLCGLSDPLLARLPARYFPDWRIGHFMRQLPTNYVHSIWTDENFLSDQKTHDYWEALRTITRAPLFSFERIRAIFLINFCLIAKPDKDLYRNDQDVPARSVPSEVSLSMSDFVQDISPQRRFLDDPQNIIFGSQVIVKLNAPTPIRSIGISLDPDDRFMVSYLAGATFHPLMTLGPAKNRDPHLASYQAAVDKLVPWTDTLRISGIAGNGHYILGDLMINNEEMPLFENSDFEKGDLRNWSAKGTAFLNQPTLGDNPLFHGRATVNLRGEYWIGTYEDRHTEKVPQGKIQTDGPTGILTSIPFTIRHNKISFLIGGGDSSANESVALIVNGRQVLMEDGWGNAIDDEKMFRIVWDVSRWKGKTARLVIRDLSTVKWGHINADDFRYLW